MAKKITFSKKAFLDIERIVEFNNNRNSSETYSKKFLIKLRNRLELLQKQPLSGVATDEEDVLVLIWDQYYIFYINSDLSLEVTSVYHQKEHIDF